MSQAQNFYQKYLQPAKDAAAGTKIFPQTILSAAALESGYGGSDLSSKYYNFFGIKKQPGDGWNGATVTLPTKEFINGEWVTVLAKFRRYNSPVDSFKNYVKFISGPRYIKAGVLDAATPQLQFAALHSAGYATDPSYATKLTNTLDNLLTSIKDIGKDPGAMGAIAGAVAFFLSLMNY